MHQMSKAEISTRFGFFQVMCAFLSVMVDTSLLSGSLPEILRIFTEQEHLWLNSFDFFVLTVPQRFLLSFYIDILVFSFHCLSIGFIASAMDCPLAHRLGVVNNLGLEVGKKNH